MLKTNMRYAARLTGEQRVKLGVSHLSEDRLSAVNCDIPEHVHMCVWEINLEGTVRALGVYTRLLV